MHRAWYLECGFLENAHTDQAFFLSQGEWIRTRHRERHTVRRSLCSLVGHFEALKLTSAWTLPPSKSLSAVLLRPLFYPLNSSRPAVSHLCWCEDGIPKAPGFVCLFERTSLARNACDVSQHLLSSSVVNTGRGVQTNAKAKRCAQGPPVCIVLALPGHVLQASSTGWVGRDPLHQSGWRQQLERTHTCTQTAVGFEAMWQRWLTVTGYRREPSGLWITLCSCVWGGDVCMKACATGCVLAFIR